MPELLFYFRVGVSPFLVFVVATDNTNKKGADRKCNPCPRLTTAPLIALSKD
ncbi:MAG: hypothetical protein AAFQ99_00260 [Pseudomonadota bacterium]